MAIVAENPGGIRYTALAEKISTENPDTNPNTVYTAVWDLDKQFPKQVFKPSRGLFKPVNEPGEDIAVPGEKEQVTQTGAKVLESDFYGSFAQWLKDDLDEVTIAVPLGGAGLKSKWGTPDVVGVYKPLARDLIKFPIEIVSAEIKIDPQQPVVAFGQAVAYRLFSSKT